MPSDVIKKIEKTVEKYRMLNTREAALAGIWRRRNIGPAGWALTACWASTALRRRWPLLSG